MLTPHPTQVPEKPPGWGGGGWRDLSLRVGFLRFCLRVPSLLGASFHFPFSPEQQDACPSPAQKAGVRRGSHPAVSSLPASQEPSHSPRSPPSASPGTTPRSKKPALSSNQSICLIYTPVKQPPSTQCGLLQPSPPEIPTAPTRFRWRLAVAGPSRPHLPLRLHSLLCPQPPGISASLSRSLSQSHLPPSLSLPLCLSLRLSLSLSFISLLLCSPTLSPI